MTIGSAENGELTFLDIIAILSFLIGLENLDLNLAQEDLDNQTKELDRRLREVVDNIHLHLQEQDKKLDLILEVISNDKNKEASGRNGR